MDYRDYVHHEMYFSQRSKELQRRAAQERLAQSMRQRPLRFYYPAMARFGHWLTVSGRRLQKRYGDLCDVSPSHHAPRKA
jgi:hypothetical protein